MNRTQKKQFSTGNPAQENGFISDVLFDRVAEKEVLETRVPWDEYQKQAPQEKQETTVQYVGGPEMATALNRSTPMAKGIKWNISNKAKISIVAYIVFLLAIIIVVVTSANRGLTSVFASTDEDEIAQEQVFSVLSMDEDFYASVVPIDYSSVEVTAEYVFVPEKQEKVSNNWFDKICDFIENTVGD